MNKLLTTIDNFAANKRHGENDWRVVQGDCLNILPKLPDKSADLIFADPPYNLQLKNDLYRPNMTRVNGVNDAWDKFNSFADYDSFCEKWLTECRRILSDNGAIWVIGTYHNIGRLATIMQNLGFWLHNDVIWHKSNPIPNFRGVRFTNATETLLWAKKSEKGRALFNRHSMKEENGGKQMTNVWQIPICNGKERLRESNGHKSHSTQKPEELIKRVLSATTKMGDTVLDPFLGTGTTLAVARKLGRVGVGIERDKKYIKLACNRVSPIIRDSNIVVEPRKPDRVPFKALIDEGFIKKGRKIYFQRGNKAAQVMSSGKIKLGEGTGSIHQMGALAGNSTECNGWAHWYIKDNNEFICIDELRKKYRDLLKGKKAA